MTTMHPAQLTPPHAHTNLGQVGVNQINILFSGLWWVRFSDVHEISTSHSVIGKVSCVRIVGTSIILHFSDGVTLINKSRDNESALCWLDTATLD